MAEELFFSNEAQQHIQTEILIQILAGQRLLLWKIANPDKVLSVDFIDKFMIEQRDKILLEFWKEHGVTPNVNEKK